MKKLISILICAIFITYILSACSEKPDIINRQAVEVKYTTACDKIETDTVYRYDWLNNKFILMPDTRTVHYNEKYEVRYNITYSDGITASEWCEVDKNTYENIKNELPP